MARRKRPTVPAAVAVLTTLLASWVLAVPNDAKEVRAELAAMRTGTGLEVRGDLD
jgi:hypothetical protein